MIETAFAADPKLAADLEAGHRYSAACQGALVAAGRVKASDARVAKLALALLTRTGPSGRPEIATLSEA